MKKLLVAAMLAVMLLFTTPAYSLTEELEKGTIMISETIGDTDFVEFLKATRHFDVPTYTVILHTNGGNAYACIGIMNRIMELQYHGVTFDMYVYGKSFSAGTYIFLLGDNRVMHSGSALMFHTMMAQATEYQKTETKKNTSHWNHLLTMDKYITAMVASITGWTPAVVDYWMNGGKAQFMSAETAHNTGIATSLRGLNTRGD